MAEDRLEQLEKDYKNGYILMINRKDKDRSSTKEREQKLNEFQDWLMSGIIDPQRAKEIIELYYKEMPF